MYLRLLLVLIAFLQSSSKSTETDNFLSTRTPLLRGTSRLGIERESEAANDTLDIE
jgi:hypothetical protein